MTINDSVNLFQSNKMNIEMKALGTMKTKMNMEYEFRQNFEQFLLIQRECGSFN